MSARRRLAVLAATASVIVGTAVWDSPASTATPARAAVTCQGSTCSGQNPNTTGCASGNVRTLEDKSYFGRLIRLRYNPDCRAAWAQLISGIPSDSALVQNSQGLTYTSTISSGSDTFTMMVDDMNLTARACVTIQTVGQACTGWH
ncbi:DUF2690 domain-containing protein [Streptomyces sp. NPDC046197]|uniref:DUF2690 domain-containing protein n=1 Tax=Streptomyces sp. NPDC046197 TaxID=3154337 RepID=UPI0033D976C6